MTYTTHGLMTPADLAEHYKDHDLAIDQHCPGHYQDPFGTTYCSIAMDCPGDGKQPGDPMDSYVRLYMYQGQNGGRWLTPAQRRRLVKKAGKHGDAVARRDGKKGLAF